MEENARLTQKDEMAVEEERTRLTQQLQDRTRQCQNLQAENQEISQQKKENMLEMDRMY